jgi:hypothetical protein
MEDDMVSSTEADSETDELNLASDEGASTEEAVSIDSPLTVVSLGVTESAVEADSTTVPLTVVITEEKESDTLADSEIEREKTIPFHGPWPHAPEPHPPSV